MTRARTNGAGSRISHNGRNGRQRNPAIGNGALHQQVQIAVLRYLKDMGGHDPDHLYHFVVEQVEAPLFSAVMDWTEGNQSRAASILGINRGTLRKKLRNYGLN